MFNTNLDSSIPIPPPSPRHIPLPSILEQYNTLISDKLDRKDIRFRKGLYVRVIYVNVLSLHHKMKVLSTGKQNGVDGLIAPPPHIYGHQLTLANICLIDLCFYDWGTLCLTLFR